QIVRTRKRPPELGGRSRSLRSAGATGGVGSSPSSGSIGGDRSLDQLGRDDAQLAGAEVLERLLQLVLVVHHERAVPGHRLADRLTTEDEQIEVRAAALLLVISD